MQSRIKIQNICLIKAISICVLSLPLLIFILFSPISSHQSLMSKLQIKNILFGVDKWYESLPSIVQAQSVLDMVIDHNKFSVTNKDQYLSCPMYTKLSQITGSDQAICSQIQQSFPQIIYVHILLDQQSEITEQIQIIKALLSKHVPQLHIEIIAQMLDASVLPHHIKDKINDEDYIKYIAHQITQLRYSKHCRYTQKKCQNWVILLTHWASLQSQFIQVGKLLFSQPNNIQEAVIRCIAGESTSVSKLNKMLKLSQLYEIKKQLVYLKDLLSNHMISANTEHVQQYLRQVNTYLNGTGDGFGGNKILNEQKSIRADIFPTQYKIGIYLPLILIIVGFPCFSVIKL